MGYPHLLVLLNSSWILAYMMTFQIQYRLEIKGQLLHFKLSKSGQILCVDKTGFPRPGHLCTNFVTSKCFLVPIATTLSMQTYYSLCLYTRRAQAGTPGFLKLFLCRRLYVCLCVCVCVCLPPRLLITSGVIWTPYDWLNKFYNQYMAIIVVIVNGHGLGIDMRHSH